MTFLEDEFCNEKEKKKERRENLKKTRNTQRNL